MTRLVTVGLLAFLLGVGFAHTCLKAGAQSQEVEAAIESAAQTYGVQEWRLRCLAWQESRYSAGAYNPAGPYFGAFQYDAGTWAYGSRLAGYEGASPYDIWAAAHTTALLIARGEGRRWPPLRWCGGFGAW